MNNEKKALTASTHFESTLLAWFRDNGRDLPWRHTHDPYAIWLSEVILQQTRIAQGTAYWERFMRRFPTVEALAAASEDEVLKLWQGLGYYSRARNLHQAARQIVSLGHFPTALSDIRRLKGVGDYTAAAIAAFAFGQPVAAVDGNAYRVLARVFGIGTPINTTAGKREFQQLADSLITTPLFNQAMMDFGATLCTPRSPACATCPLAEDCVALREGRTDELPVKEHKTTIKTRHLIYIWMRCQGMTALHRRGKGDIWQGLWEPPVIEDAPLPRLEGRLTPLSQGVRHVLTHRILIADFYLLETTRRPNLPDGYIWVDESDVGRYAVPRLVERLIEVLPKAQ